MKSLNTYLTEKLLVNKNFKSGIANIEFYNKFRNFLSSKSEIGWFEMNDIKDNIPERILIKDKTASNKIKEFFNNDDIKYIIGVTDHYEEICELYYDMLKFIDDNKDDMEFFYINESPNSKEYLTYLFEAVDIKVGIWGYETIVVGERSPRVIITFQYI